MRPEYEHSTDCKPEPPPLTQRSDVEPYNPLDGDLAAHRVVRSSSISQEAVVSTTSFHERNPGPGLALRFRSQG